MSDALFVTRLYQGRILVVQGLEKTCLGIAAEERAIVRQVAVFGEIRERNTF